MRKLILVISLLCFAFSSSAAVYKHLDEHGNLIKYSDQPQKPGDKPLDLPKPAATSDPEVQPTFKPPKPKQAEPESKPAIAYVAVAIVKPENEDTIRANGGVFPIQLASQPPLNQAAGHRYVVVVDGEKHQESTTTEFNLMNMDRGQHSISIEVRDNEGNVLTSSSSITVHVLRASAR